MDETRRNQNKTQNRLDQTVLMVQNTYNINIYKWTELQNIVQFTILY